MKSNLTCRRGKKRGDPAKDFLKKKEKKKKKRIVGCRILIGVFVANLNFSSSGLVDVKLFCSGLFKS